MKYLVWFLLVCPLFAARPTPPSKIKIGVFEYTIKMQDGYFTCGAVRQAVGCQDSETLEIKIKKGMALQAEQEVLWHEVKHAVDRTFIVDGEGEEFSDEDWVEHSSPGELAVMRENPKLMDYLLWDEHAIVGDKRPAIPATCTPWSLRGKFMRLRKMCCWLPAVFPNTDPEADIDPLPPQVNCVDNAGKQRFDCVFLRAIPDPE